MFMLVWLVTVIVIERRENMMRIAQKTGSLDRRGRLESRSDGESKKRTYRSVPLLDAGFDGEFSHIESFYISSFLGKNHGEST